MSLGTVFMDSWFRVQLLHERQIESVGPVSAVWLRFWHAQDLLLRGSDLWLVDTAVRWFPFQNPENETNKQTNIKLTVKSNTHARALFGLVNQGLIVRNIARFVGYKVISVLAMLSGCLVFSCRNATPRETWNIIFKERDEWYAIVRLNYISAFACKNDRSNPFALCEQSGHDQSMHST